MSDPGETPEPDEASPDVPLDETTPPLDEYQGEDMAPRRHR